MYVGETVNFTCAVHVSSGWTYKWYRNNVGISHTGSTLSIRLGRDNAGKYTCKAIKADGIETHSSEKKTQAVDDVPEPSVKLVTPWADVFVNEVVTLSCEVASTGWSFSWLKNGQTLSADGDLLMTGANLNIIALRSHTGAYSCKANHKDRPVHSEPSQPLDVKVYENIPKPTLSQIDPSYDPMYVGETVHFACSVNVSSGWKFKLFKDEREITSSDSSISVQLRPSDGGKYSCKGTRGGQTTTDHSDKISLTVLEIPIPQLKALTPWLDVFPYETVKMGCGATSTPSDWIYEWYKEEQAVSRTSNSVSSDGATLTINSAASSDRGQYKCKATLKSRQVITSYSAGLTVNVYDQKPRPILIQDPDYSILFPQEPLSLQCHINISNGWEFVWYKNNEKLTFNQNKYEVTPDTAHSGSYTCEATRGKDPKFTSDLSQAKNVEIRKDAPEPVLAQVPAVDKVYVGEQLMLKCNLDVSRDWEYHWYKDEQIIFSNVSSITVNATHPHSEVYKCEAKRRKTRFETKSQPKVIAISAIPTPSVKGVTPWLDVFPGETVSLSCGMKTEASDWLYKWSKDGQPIKYEESVKSDREGTSLTIISSVSHAGEYSCMAEHRERAVFSDYSSGIRLQVYDTKPRVTLVQDPEVKVFHTQDSVFFSCGVNVSSGWEYSWYRNDQMLASGPNFTISPLFTSHSGEYKCRAKRGREVAVFHTDHSWSVTLNVNERPSASILLLTGWSEVFSTDSLTLECEAKDTDDGDWRFKWFKGGEEIAQNMSKHLVTPQNDPEQSEYTCQGVRTGRPSYTTSSEPLKTKNLLLKRRVLLSISGCLVFGICAVFLGCILLRVFRKPVIDQDKPEEADLFLTMAQLEKVRKLNIGVVLRL
uniref:Ig-like domain-containing protein n=2 Tax=Neogobius melanostomus TaxID=47308 RepID=A0A8C6TBT6_9GOBI